MQRRILSFAILLLLLGTLSGCRSVKAMLNPPPKEKSATQKAAVRQHRSPTDVFPFSSQKAPPPSMFDETLSPQEQALLKEYQKSGDLTPKLDDTKESKASRNWVFGY